MNGDSKTRKRSSAVHHVNFAFDPNEFGDNTGMPNDFYSGIDEADLTYPYEDTERLQLSSNETDQFSCWKQCTHGVRSLWATRLTEDMQGNRDLYIHTTLRELILYVLFLITLMIIAFGPINEKSYLLTRTMEDAFMESTVQNGDLSLSTVTNLDDLWTVLQDPVMRSLYDNRWYNDQPMRKDGRLSVRYDNQLIGIPRIRQLRMASNSCLVPTDFRDDIKECYGQYDIAKEDKSPFGPKNGTAWVYTNSDELDMAMFWGTAGVYGGGGYYEDLSNNYTMADAQLQYLFNNLWFDRGTRAVFLHFTSYNPNLNLFCVSEIVIESPGSGGLSTTYEFRSIKLLRYVTTFDYFVLACECIFMLFTLYYIVEEIMEISKHKCSYFTSVWNWLDIIIIILSLMCAAFNIYRTIKVDEILDDLLVHPDKFANFQLMSVWQVNFNYGIAITTFLAWMKIFKYISFNKTMTQLSSTLGNCAKDLAGFAVMFFIVFFSFAELGYLAFGTQVDDFSQFMTSVYTLFRIILGDFDFNSLERANSIFGPIYFIVYVFFVFFVLINMFIAIINETYVGVKSDLQTQSNDFEMKDFFKKRMKKMMDRMKKKKNQIEKLQQAMELANTNKTGRLDFVELRQHLNSQGFTTEEIDNVFGRFDTDQDQALSSTEQLKMQAKLEEEKLALVTEIAKEEQVAIETGMLDEPSRLPPEVTQQEFTRVLKRVGRIEAAMSTMMQHLNTVLQGLSSVEKAKLIRREAMTQLLQTVMTDDPEQRETQMSGVVKSSLDKYETVKDDTEEGDPKE